MLQRKRFIVRIVLLLVFSLIVIKNYNGEIVSINEGAGWDGSGYREVIVDFENKYFSGEYSTYHSHRVLPFMITHYAMKAFDIPFTNDNINKVSSVQNIILLVILFTLFFSISNIQKWKVQTEIIAFCFTFLNYHVSKFLGYVPIFTDMSALVLSYAVVYVFLKYKNTTTWPYVLLCLLGFMTWPVVSMVAFILYAFPTSKVEITEGNDWFNGIIRTAYTIVFPLLFVAYVAYRFRVKHVDSLLDVFYIRPAINEYMIIPAVIACMAFYWVATKYISVNWKTVWKEISVRRVLLSGIVFVVIYKLTEIFGKGNSLLSSEMVSNQFSVLNELGSMGQFPMTDILIFVETPFIYLGLFMVFIIVFWRSICYEVTNRYGIGYFFVLLLALLFLADIETRKLTTFYPIMLVPLMDIINKVDIKRWAVGLLVAVQAVLSFFWFNINVPGIQEAFEVCTTEEYMKFPAQRYYMFQGPWQSHEVYFAAITVELLLIVCLLCGRKSFVRT